MHGTETSSSGGAMTPVLLIYMHLLCAAVELPVVKASSYGCTSEIHSLSTSLKTFLCQAVDQSTDVTKPAVVLSLKWSDLDYTSPNGTSAYIQVDYGKSQNESIVTRDIDIGVTQNTTVYLQEDALYTLSVYLTCDNISTLVNNCTINTIDRRTSIVRGLSVTCPAVNSSVIKVEWISPEKSPYVDVYRADFYSICLHGNHTLQKDITKTNSMLTTDDELVITLLDLVTLDAGSVCLIGGIYFIRNPRLVFRTPFENCGVPFLSPKGRAQLRLSCSDSVAAVEIVTPDDADALNSTMLQGKCITDILGPNMRYLDPGNDSISDLPVGSICSFFGSYRLQNSEAEDFEPVQCVVSDRVSAPSFTTTTLSLSSPTTSSTPTSTYSATSPVTHPTPNSTPSNRTTYTRTTTIGGSFIWVIIMVTMIVVLVTVLGGGLVWMLCWWRVRMEHQIRQHIMWGNKNNEDLGQDPCVHPQFKCTPDFIDSLSATTEVEYLYKGGLPSPDNSSLPSRSSSQWKISHESLSSFHPTHQCNDGRLCECGERKSCEFDIAKCESTNEQTGDTCLDCDSQNSLPPCYITCSNIGIQEGGHVSQVTTKCVSHSKDCTEYTQSSKPPENCFTDDEGYLRIKDYVS